MSPSASPRFALIDALKGVASQFIVLHHLAFYGPMSDVALPLLPVLIGWFSQHGRLAVAVFLAMGGFLAARSLAPDGLLSNASPLALLRRRYLKLVLPYSVALLLAVLAAVVARSLHTHEVTPAAPSWPQGLAHLLLLQDLVGAEALSAGVWYVAIDFQAFALLLGLLWLARRLGARLGWGTAATRRLGMGLVTTLAVLSMGWFNRVASLDTLALYFFGSYGLGAAAWWVSSRALPWRWGLVLAAVALAALAVDFRSRLAVALAVAVLLALGHGVGWAAFWPRSRWLGRLGNVSYAVFLLNFPVALVVNAVFTVFLPAQPGWQAAGLLLAWGLCNLAGVAFHRWVETPVGRWRV